MTAAPAPGHRYRSPNGKTIVEVVSSDPSNVWGRIIEAPPKTMRRSGGQLIRWSAGGFEGHYTRINVEEPT